MLIFAFSVALEFPEHVCKTWLQTFKFSFCILVVISIINIILIII